MDDMYNPAKVIKDRQNMLLTQSLRATAGLNWKIIKGLNYHSELTLARNYTQIGNWRGPTPASGNEVNYLNSDGTLQYSGDADLRKNDARSNTVATCFHLQLLHSKSELS